MNIGIPSLSRYVNCLVLVCALAGGSAHAEISYQVHGFASQSFISSGGNNFFGDSTHGSFNFYEAGVNGTVSPLPDLLFSAQVVLRDAGNSDNEGLRLDYAFADYQFLSQADTSLGLRAGRVKNQFGFYNDTRDVVFTRPGILLPQSIYYEGSGLRGLLFATNGVQAYADTNVGEHFLSASATWGPNFNASEEDERVLSAGTPLPGHVRFNNFYGVRFLDEINSGRLKFGLSYLHANLELIPNPGIPFNADIDAALYVLSASYNAEVFSLISEYRLTTTKGQSFGAPLDSKGDGYYLQGEYRLPHSWTLMARYDALFNNRNDRDGETFAAQTGGNRYSQFSRDVTVGAKWLYNDHWGIWGEVHVIDGTATVPLLDNLGRSLSNHWSMFLLMAAYRF